MLTRKYDINVYDTYLVKEVIRNIIGKEYKAYMLYHQHPFLFDGQVDNLEIVPTVSFNFPTDNTLSIEDKIKTLGGRLATEIFMELHRRYDVKVVNTLKDFDDIKEKCDYIFEDDKTYIALCKQLDNLYVCEAVTALKSLYNKIMNSSSTRNITYQIRNTAYKNLKTPSNIGCV